MSVDGLAIIWYAAICGGLSALAPAFGGRMVRVAIGAAVGVSAAIALPLFKTLVGV